MQHVLTMINPEDGRVYEGFVADEKEVAAARVDSLPPNRQPPFHAHVLLLALPGIAERATRLYEEPEA